MPKKGKGLGDMLGDTLENIGLNEDKDKKSQGRKGGKSSKGKTSKNSKKK